MRNSDKYPEPWWECSLYLLYNRLLFTWCSSFGHLSKTLTLGSMAALYSSSLQKNFVSQVGSLKGCKFEKGKEIKLK
jgi:hypothetical protein